MSSPLPTTAVEVGARLRVISCYLAIKRGNDEVGIIVARRPRVRGAILPRRAHRARAISRGEASCQKLVNVLCPYHVT